MTPLEVAEEIRAKIIELGKGHAVLREAAEEKARSIGAYDKACAVTIIKLRNGVEMELDGEKIQNPPVSIIDKLVKGICHEQKVAADAAECEYKRVVKKLDVVQAQLNGWQSINRFLDKV